MHPSSLPGGCFLLYLAWMTLRDRGLTAGSVFDFRGEALVVEVTGLARLFAQVRRNDGLGRTLLSWLHDGGLTSDDLPSIVLG